MNFKSKESKTSSDETTDSSSWQSMSTTESEMQVNQTNKSTSMSDYSEYLFGITHGIGTVEDHLSNSSLDVNFDEKSDTNQSFIDSPFSSVEDASTRRQSSSTYRFSNRSTLESSVLDNFLDFLSNCFWKCSSGCQQLPDKNR